jgi:DNA invertase Pin-like site-specific DNA recombinase
MRIKKLTDGSVPEPGQLLVVLHCMTECGYDVEFRKCIGTGVVQFYRHRQKPVPWISRSKNGRLFRRPRTTNERSAAFEDVMSGRKTEKDRPGFAAMLKAAHQRKFDIVVFWALDRLTREGTRATLNYLQRLESKGVDYVSYQEQWLDSTGPFKDVMISMFATLAKQERARISERTIAGLTVARAKGKRLGRPPLAEETVRTVLSLNQDAGIGARKIAKSTGFPLGTVNAILTRSRQQTR